MIVADTNVLSEPLKRSPDERVLAWLRAAGAEVALTSVTVGELLYGAERLPDSVRRHALLDAIDHLVDEAGDRVLPFDTAAARAYAQLRARLQRHGRVVGAEDLMIAATCLAWGLPLATRNVRDFDGLGLTVVDPWQEPPDAGLPR